MLRIRFLGASALAFLALFGAALAADVQKYPAPKPQPYYAPTVTPYSGWGGPYAGLIAGYGWAGTTIANHGWIGGAYVGWNADIDRNLIVGIEADGTFTGKTGANGGTTVKNQWDATLRARVGFGGPRLLLYGTGGVAIGNVQATTGVITENATKVGWTAGAGVEKKITAHLTGRIEYRYTSLGTATFVSSPAITYRSNDALIGIGVKF